jgi:hypothetical protein
MNEMHSTLYDKPAHCLLAAAAVCSSNHPSLLQLQLVAA